MDAFYASVEQLIILLCEVNLSLWVVLKTGAWLQQSYEAREFGVSAMSGLSQKRTVLILFLLAHVLIVTKKFRIKFRVF
jgi:nucleotidyltransferase/DNA polymerase involved in DNA repair